MITKSTRTVCITICEVFTLRYVYYYCCCLLCSVARPPGTKMSTMNRTRASHFLSTGGSMKVFFVTAMALAGVSPKKNLARLGYLDLCPARSEDWKRLEIVRGGGGTLLFI